MTGISLHGAMASDLSVIWQVIMYSIKKYMHVQTVTVTDLQIYKFTNHVEQMGPRFFDLDAPKASLEDQRPNRLTDQRAQHVQVLLSDALKWKWDIEIMN
jgi:hypothetical protein